MSCDEPEAHHIVERGTCVILCRPGASGPAAARSVTFAPSRDLMDALERKGLALRVCASHAEALADVVIHERSLRNGAVQRAIILLLIEPEQSPGVMGLVERVQTFAPRTMIWRYSPAHKPALSAWTAPRSAKPESQSPTIQASARFRPAPALRLTETEQASGSGRATQGSTTDSESGLPSPKSKLAGAAADSAMNDQTNGIPDFRQETHEGHVAPILSQDELSMLLSDDWESHT